MRPNLNLTQKAALLSGETVWQTRAIPSAGVPALFLSDGPHGIRKQSGEGDHLGLHGSEPATCFPTAATVANSWDAQLGEEIGRAIGMEACSLGVDVVLGPGLNIKRSPLGGRNFEYFSEDPHLAGIFAAGYVRGIQAGGALACPKHFAANSQETLRMSTDSRVDERTLREIYLTGFEIAIKDAQPAVLMSSYNRVNGEYAHENSHLLKDVLQEEWGFDGLVVSDWGGSNDAVEAAAHGGTLEMPAPGLDSAHQILRALESGRLSETDLNERVEELLRTTQRARAAAEVRNSVDFQAHHSLARRASAESAVLLKNDAETLPLAAGTSVALIGDFAKTPRYQGAGSSLVNPTQLSTATDIFPDSDLQMIGYAQGFVRNGSPDQQLFKEALTLAGQAQVVLLWLGLDELSESEGQDRKHMKLPQNQLDLLAALSMAGHRVVVVLSGGSAVEVPWIDQPAVVLHAYLGGQAAAEGVLDVLTGSVNPSGRLAETYPKSLADTPTASAFPVEHETIDYHEGLFVGYRYYTSAEVETAFPFGYGLSYTRFEHRDLRVSNEGARFTVVNTGLRAGAEVSQLYVARSGASVVQRPVRELKGFTKTWLQPGEEKEVFIDFDELTFRHYDVEACRWQIEAGAWEIQIGSDAETILLRAEHQVSGTVEPPDHSVHQHSTSLNVEVLRRFPLVRGPVDSRGRRALGRNDPLGAMSGAKSPLARGAAGILRRLHARSARKGEPDLNLLFLQSMPFRAIGKMTGGAVNAEMVDALVRIVNGRHCAGVADLVGAARRNRRVTKRLQRLLDSESETSSAQTQESETKDNERV